MNIQLFKSGDYYEGRATDSIYICILQMVGVKWLSADKLRIFWDNLESPEYQVLIYIGYKSCDIRGRFDYSWLVTDGLQIWHIIPHHDPIFRPDPSHWSILEQPEREYPCLSLIREMVQETIFKEIHAT